MQEEAEIFFKKAFPLPLLLISFKKFHIIFVFVVQNPKI